MIKRDFQGRDGEAKSVWSGDVADPTGNAVVQSGPSLRLISNQHLWL